MSTDWNVLRAFVVTCPSIGPDGKPGPPGRLVTGSEERAREIVAGHSSRSYREVTEKDLTDVELANLRRTPAAAPHP